MKIVLKCPEKYIKARLVIGTSRTVGSAKKFVRITSGFGGGEFTKTLRKVCTCQKLKIYVLFRTFQDNFHVKLFPPKKEFF
jgi:hypothetical protein